MHVVETLAESAAISINRRRFIRRLANGVFYVAATTAAGGGLSILRSTVAWATDETCCEGSANAGIGCPSSTLSGYPCGPSRCCNYTNGRPANCDCATNSGGCKSNAQSNNCHGQDLRHYGGTGCWTCRGPCFRCNTTPPQQCRKVTTCCDCKTTADNCNDVDQGGNRGRCISWDTQQVVVDQVGCDSSGPCA